MSLVVRKPAFCICENKDADQLRSYCAADHRLCFRYTDSTIPLLHKPKFQASSHLIWLYSAVCVGPGRKPRRPGFSQRGSNKVKQEFFVQTVNTLYCSDYFTLCWALLKISLFIFDSAFNFPDFKKICYRSFQACFINCSLEAESLNHVKMSFCWLKCNV